MIIQFIKFGLVGVSNTVLSLCITYLAIAIFGYCFNIYATWSLNICTTIGYVVGVCNSYFWNNKFVFKNKKENDKRKRFAKVFICYGITYLISMVMMDFLVEVCHVPSIIAPVPRLIITIPLNFIANKLWAFKDYEFKGK
ncbi:MAG: GtrA family protein [Lachnospiraceae bacterium]|nr:GtrA family protein [Lachnospiraceae bacterium]